MKKSLIVVIAAMALLAISGQAMAQDVITTPTPPTKIFFTEGNFLGIQFVSTPAPHIFMYKGGAFPSGTQTQIQTVTLNGKSEVTIEFRLPGQTTWNKLTWSMLKCKNGSEKGCDAPPTTPPPETKKEPEKFQCDPGRALGMGLLGAGAGFGLGSIRSEANAGDAHAEVNGNPLLGAAAGALLVPGLDCLVQYAQWKKEHRPARN